MFESVYIAATQVVPSMGLLDRLFKSKRPGDRDAESGVPEAVSEAPGAPPRPAEPDVPAQSGPSRPAPTMVIRPRGPGMITGGAQAPVGVGAAGIPRPASPQGTGAATHGATGLPVQLTQRISLRPGGAPQAGMTPPRPKKETQRFALAPAASGTPLPPPDAGVVPGAPAEGGDSQRLIFPLGMVLRSLPPEVLSTDLGQLLARPTVAGGTVSVPMDQVLRQLPTGVVQFTFDVFQAQIPRDLLLPPDQLATHWDRPIRLPLGEVVSRIPPEAMGRRSATPVKEQQEYESIDAPFRVQPQGARGRRTSRLTPPPEEPVAPAPVPEPVAEPAVQAGIPSPEFPQVPADVPAFSEAMPFEAEGFQPFRKAVAPVGQTPEAPGSGVAAPMGQPLGTVPFQGVTPSQSAPTMGMTGQISLMDLESEADIQREPTQRLSKPPPGLIAIRPPATSALPFPAEEGDLPAGIPLMAPEPARAAFPEPPAAEKAEGFGGGLSALASLAAMADSEPPEAEEEPSPEPPQAKPAPVEPQLMGAPPAGPVAQGGAWWDSGAGKADAAGPASVAAPAPPDKSPLSGLAAQWLAMQGSAEEESQAKAPPSVPAPAVEPPAAFEPPTVAPARPVQEKTAAPTARNWWETPLEESELVEASPAVSDVGLPDELEAKPEVESRPAIPAEFPPIFVAKAAPKPEEPQMPAVAAEPPPIFAAKAVIKPGAAPGFVPPLSAVVPDLRHRPGAQPRPPSVPVSAPVVQRPEAAPVAALRPETPPRVMPVSPKVPSRPPQPSRPPLVRAPEAEPQFAAFAFPAEAAPSSAVAPAPLPQKPVPAPRKPVTLASAGRIGAQGRPKGTTPPIQPIRETEVLSAPRQRSPIPVPKMRADRLSGLLRAAASWTPRSAIAVAARPINPRRILSRWLGLEVEREVPIQQVPHLLVNSPHVKGAAIVDEEGLTLTSHLPEGVSEQAVGALSSRLFNQLRTAASEVGSQFANQAIMTLGRWTVQITFEKPFYLVTLHDSPHFPPAVARRMRKIAGALVRQEFGG